MTEKKSAAATGIIHPIIANRWSPRAFADKEVSETQLQQLLEAARWAPSSYNEQPWRYIYAHRENKDGFNQLLQCLNEGNANWAAKAGVLMLASVSTTFTRNGKENRHAKHDVGAANLALALQATHLGLFVHQMAGFDQDKARETFGIEDPVEPLVMIAIGYRGEVDELPENLREKELSSRSRKPIEDWATKL